MATPREVRRLGFQILFQLDAQGGEGSSGSAMDQWVNATEHAEGFTAKERAAALSVARSAFAERGKADAAMVALAPDWPTHRQAAPDRAILRLAFFEMHSGKAPPKAVISDSVELAKEFSTEKSPGFVNALLDKVLKKQRAAVHGDDEEHEGEDAGTPAPEQAGDAQSKES